MELKVDKVAMLVGVSVRTVNNWYWFKGQNPNNEYSKMLPNFKIGDRGCRLWNSDDIPKLVQFKEQLPHGRNGVLGSVTQRYYKKKGDKDGKSIKTKTGADAKNAT